MSNIIGSLSLLKGWTDYNDVKTNQNIPPQNPGQVWRLKLEYDGWLRCLLGSVSSPYASIAHTIFEKPQITTPFQLYVQSLISPPPNGNPWLYKYDVVNNIYTLAWTPISPQEFKKGQEITVTAPTVNPITGALITTQMIIYTSWIYVTYVTDEEALKKSVRELFGTPYGVRDLLGTPRAVPP